MTEQEQTKAGVYMLSAGRSDEQVERLIGMSLLRIIELRAEAATAPACRSAGKQHMMKNAAVPLATQRAPP